MRGSRSTRRALAAACLTGLCLAGCTTDPADHPGTRADRTAATSGRTPASLHLGCADGGSADQPNGSGDVSLAGVTLEDLAQPMADVPRAVDVGITTSDAHQLFRKVPAYLRAGTGPVTVRLGGSGAGQALAWVPADDWTGAPDVRPWTTREITLDGCADRDVVYFGGVLAGRPDTCLQLSVESSDHRPETRRLELDGSPC